MQILTVENTKIKVPGLKRNYIFFQISDSHIAYASPDASQEDKDRAVYFTEMWTNRSKYHYTPIQAFDEIIAYVNNEVGDALLITGDLFEGGDRMNNVDFLQSRMAACNKEFLYVVGNHEAGSFHIPEGLASFMPGNGFYWVKDYGDLLVVGLDDNKRSLLPEQIAFLKEQTARNIPILLIMHIPIYADSCDKAIRRLWGDTGHEQYTIGLDNTPEETMEFIEYLKQDGNNIIAIAAGHAHLSCVGEFAPGRLQFITAPSFDNFIRRIELVAE